MTEEDSRSWTSRSNAPPPIEKKDHMKENEATYMYFAYTGDLSEVANDSTRLLALQSPRSGDWLQTLPITTEGYR